MAEEINLQILWAIGVPKKPKLLHHNFKLWGLVPLHKYLEAPHYTKHDI